MMANNRRGAAVQILLAILLTMMIASTAYLLTSMQQSLRVSALMSIKADYQIESAIIMLLQKFRSGEQPETDAPVLQRHIAPGVELTIDCKPVSGETWLFEARVEGPGMQRQVTGIGNFSHPDRIIYQ